MQKKNITGESHLQELVTKKFDKYKQEREEKEEIINNLIENFAKVTQKVDDLSEAVKKQEQYSRCNSMVVHRIPRRKQENTDELCIKVNNEHLDLDIKLTIEVSIEHIMYRIREILMKNQNL